MNKMLIVFFMVEFSFVFVGCEKDSTRSAEKSFGVNPSNAIHFIVPVGFRGKIEIVEDKINGIAPPIKDSVIEIQIPTNGHITLKDWEPLFSEHSEYASYADGTPIPDPNKTPSGQEFPRNEVGYYALGTEMGTNHYKETLVNFIGTKEELEKLK